MGGSRQRKGVSGLEIFFGRRSRTAALGHNEMDMSSGIRFVGQPDGGEGRGPHEMDVIAPNMEVSGDAGGYATCGGRISESGSCCLHRGTFASQRRNAVFYEH